MSHRRILSILALLALLLSACDVLAPAVIEPTSPPATAAPAPTATPTLGPREFIDAAYCWESHVDVGEFELLRFFDNGVVLDAFVQPFASCADAWKQAGVGLTLEKQKAVSHGEYYLSGETIRFTLAPPGSDEVAGEVTGTYAPERLVLKKQGVEDWVFERVSGN